MKSTGKHTIRNLYHRSETRQYSPTPELNNPQDYEQNNKNNIDIANDNILIKVELPKRGNEALLK